MEKEALHQVNDVDGAIEVYKEFSRMLYELSEDYEKQLNSSLHLLETQHTEEIITIRNALRLRNKFRSCFVRAVRLAFRFVRRILTVLGLKKLLKRSGLFRILAEKGLIEKLNRKRG